jgi:hypothetical protein
MWVLLIQLLVTLVIVVIVFLLPSVYDIGSYSKVFDLHEIVARESEFSSLTQQQNIVGYYYPSPNLQILTNISYIVDATTNSINLKINNVDYTFQLEDPQTKKIVIPILLSSQQVSIN